MARKLTGIMNRLPHTPEGEAWVTSTGRMPSTIFHLDSKDFSPELRANLIERLKTSKESLHRVVEDAVFMIFRARHRMIFYQHIEPEGLRWEFV